MDENKIEAELNSDPFFNAIIWAVQASERETKMINPVRYKELLIAKEAVDDLLAQNGETEKSIVKLHHAFCSASICAEVESFEVHDMAAFSIAIATANNFEFYPLTNGKMKVTFTFNHVLISLG